MSPEVSDILVKAREQYAAEDFGAAKESFDRAVALDPHNYILLTNRAVVELQLNQKQAALNDIEEATRLHRLLPPQTSSREKAYELVIANTRIQAYASNNKDVKAVLKDIDPTVNDVTDTIMRIYVSAGNAAFSAQLWNDAAANYETAKSFARALRNDELELICYVNAANSLFNLKGREAESLDQAKKGLELLPAFKLNVERSAYFGGQLLNAKGLALGAVSDAQSTLEEQEGIFTEGISKVEKYAPISDSGVDILASLLGNRGDVRSKLGNLEGARVDFTASMKRYIKRHDASGISRQLSGLAKISLSKKDTQLGYAYAVSAVKLGSNKVARDRDEDQQLLSSSKALLTEVQIRQVDGNPASFLAKETEVEESRWKSLLQ
ncbi:hypothetical protein [Roseimicrobium sp. ORNL1]|uniref:hypothetical protein n=1 Tax=Roseimicrobium sp. ORNL1 TaxID=2711231 RepID=UPI0013E1F0A7|nr:hypothetical protein [Roseimicrobium sp. ORNL1]QIF03152.1 hypothetical protein G5S37_17020 [Roseimicrobium sp. ORNL1]